MFEKPVEAVLFDMDGLLLDTEALYARSMQAAAGALGRDMPLAFCHSMIGVPAQECYAMIREFYGPELDLDAFRAQFSVHFRRLREDRIPVKPGAVELLDYLRERGVPTAVATSARRQPAEHHLAHAGLLGRFTAIATVDDVERAKPHPDVYLEAARRVGVAPAHCVALEDSNIGLTAAHAAGTMAIMVPDMVPPTPEVRAKCLHVADDLHAVLKLLRGVLAEPLSS
ncbi:MAG: HAD family phosphatase [Enhydrobacter sp.]|nr:MAG: HAD family phosphatase [Enhydrobacter sp.]